MVMRDIFGIATAIIVLAGVSVAIVNGGDTAKVISSIATGFNSVVRTATLGGK